MKKGLFILCTLINIVAHAGELGNYSLQSLSTDFAAPVIYDRTQFLQAPAGSILYDSKALGFFALPPNANPASGWVQISTSGAGALNSNVIVSNGNGHGTNSSYVNVRNYSVIQNQTGGDITYANPSTSGASFTINTAGTYSIARVDDSSVGQTSIGIEVTHAGGTIFGSTSPCSLTWANGGRGCINSPSASAPGSYSITLYLNAGDIVSPIDLTATDETSEQGSWFSITRVN